MVGERIKDALDREPIWRKVENRFSNTGHRVRNIPGSKIRANIPGFQNRNFGEGKGIGFIEAAIQAIVQAYLPLQADADVQSVSSTEGGTKYIVNVNASTEEMARARAFVDAGTGFTAILTDTLRVQNVEVIGTRTLRDTYQVELMIED